MPGARRVRIVTDSTADLPPDLVSHWGIQVVPTYLHLGDKSFRDGIDLSLDELLLRLKAKEYVTTSQPSLGAFKRIYEQTGAGGGEIVSIHLSAGLSGTYQSALLAAEQVDGHVTVLDSGQLSMAMGWQVLAAAQAAREGRLQEEVVGLVEEMKGRCHILCMIESLEHLRRGGRIGRAQEVLGALFNVRPIITVRQGVVGHPGQAGRARGDRSCGPRCGGRLLRDRPPGLAGGPAMAPAALNREALGLIPWVVVSWLGATIVPLLVWFARRRGRFIQKLLHALFYGPLFSPAEAVLALYAIGLPYVAIITGFVDPPLMGLGGFSKSWWEAIAQASVVGAALLFMAGVTWHIYLRAAIPPAGFFERSQRLAATPAGRILFLPWAAAEEMHWAFYRVLPALIWRPEVGLWVGLLLVIAERYGNPSTLARLRQPGGVEEEAWWLTKVVAMTAAYGLIGNLWLCIALHALLEGSVAWLVRLRRARGTAPVTPAEVPATALGAAILPPMLVLLLLGLFTWQAIQPFSLQSLPWRPVAAPPLPTVPTPTPTATPLPSPTPTPTPTVVQHPTPTATRTPRTYVVQEGDTVNAIADAFGISPLELMQANSITDASELQVGQVLVIP